MLILTRRSGERLTIGDEITVAVIEIRGKYVRLGIDAPQGIRIHRTEIAVRDDGGCGPAGSRGE